MLGHVTTRSMTQGLGQVSLRPVGHACSPIAAMAATERRSSRRADAQVDSYTRGLDDAPAASAAMKPHCVAPWTALLVDPDKSVRPCCSYTDWGRHVPNSHGLGVLSDSTTLQDIASGEAWRGVQREFEEGKIPEGCRICIQRETETGFGLRHDYDRPTWNQGLTYLELNTSNLCTLQCRHCGPFFSHRWAAATHSPLHKPDNRLLVDSLRQLDLSHLEYVTFKGGEPLMNSDVPAALQLFDSLGVLQRLQVHITTNGTILDESLMALLQKARRVHFTLSVDGVGEVQAYIRHGKSELSNIERFVERYAALHPTGWRKKKVRVTFSPLTSIMVYNVFSLPDVADWWGRVAARFPAHTTPISFHHFVVDPDWLSLPTLREATRRQLIDKYEQLDARLYANVIRTLRLPFAGEEQHRRFVAETRQQDQLLGRSVSDAVPELTAEMAG